jgi:hypothetical protein
VHTTFPLTGTENINPHQLPNPFPSHNKIQYNTITAFFFLSYQEVIEISNLSFEFSLLLGCRKERKKEKHSVSTSLQQK